MIKYYLVDVLINYQFHVTESIVCKHVKTPVPHDEAEYHNTLTKALIRKEEILKQNPHRQIGIRSLYTES